MERTDIDDRAKTSPHGNSIGINVVSKVPASSNVMISGGKKSDQSNLICHRFYNKDDKLIDILNVDWNIQKRRQSKKY